jgi:hypothetical protein
MRSMYCVDPQTSSEMQNLWGEAMTTDLTRLAERSAAVTRGRAEAQMSCPLCGQTGGIRASHRSGGLHTFVCSAYRYDPDRQNECGFAFAVHDEQLRRFA